MAVQAAPDGAGVEIRPGGGSAARDLTLVNTAKVVSASPGALRAALCHAVAECKNEVGALLPLKSMEG
jgi:hypothetical protein